MSAHKLANLVNEKLKPFHGDNEHLGFLLSLCVGRLMLKSMRNGHDGLNICRNEDIRHVVDWLKAAIINSAKWLENIDRQGRPKKLLKFSTLPDLLKEVDKSMLIEAQKYQTIKFLDGDEMLFEELSGDMHLVRLMTPAALDRESAEMQHCIGNGGYDELLIQGSCVFLSLRDKYGKAHATLEIDGDAIVQLQGKQNQLPAIKYIDTLLPFMKDYRLFVDIPACILGHVVDNCGDWHQLDKLPDGLIIEGDLDLRYTDVTTLPERLDVGGTLILDNIDMLNLPEGLKVGGNLYISQSGITTLPEGLVVKGDLYASHSKLIALPHGLNVGKCLLISQTKIIEVPDDIILGGDLYIKNTDIKKLPDIISDNKCIVTAEGTMSAKKFRNAFTKNTNLTEDDNNLVV